MTYTEAIEAIKKNYPPENYTILREALDLAIEALGNADKSEKLRSALEEVRETEWELAGEETPAYLIAHYALEETK